MFKNFYIPENASSQPNGTVPPRPKESFKVTAKYNYQPVQKGELRLIKVCFYKKTVQNVS